MRFIEEKCIFFSSLDDLPPVCDADFRCRSGLRDCVPHEHGSDAVLGRYLVGLRKLLNKTKISNLQISNLLRIRLI